MNYFFCSIVYDVTVSAYYCEIFKFCFWIFCGDVMVSDGISGLISIV